MAETLKTIKRNEFGGILSLLGMAPNSPIDLVSRRLWEKVPQFQKGHFLFKPLAPFRLLYLKGQ
jgi:hypothetical protein